MTERRLVGDNGLCAGLRESLDNLPSDVIRSMPKLVHVRLRYELRTRPYLYNDLHPGQTSPERSRRKTVADESNLITRLHAHSAQSISDPPIWSSGRRSEEHTSEL